MLKRNFKIEISRKLVHLSSSSIAMSIYFLDKYIYIPVLCSVTVFFIIFDILRINFEKINYIYNFFFLQFTRDNEKNKLTGASYLFLGALIVALIFEKKIVVVGLLVTSISDSMAAIIGIVFGKTRLFNKTLEGSTAFFISTFTILTIFKFNLVAALLISLISTITELFSSTKYNDNILIPISTCSVIYMLSML